MRRTNVRKKHVQQPTDLHEYAWAETDIFARTVSAPPKPHDVLRVRFEWGF